MASGEIKYIAQGLKRAWEKEKTNDTESCKVAPLEYYLRYNYETRYVALCNRLEIKPVGFGAWLRKPISSII